MKTTGYIGFIVGLSAFTALLIYQGVGEISSALAVAGWWLLAITAYHLLPMLLSTIGWCALMEKRIRPPFLILLWIRWIGEGINALLPAAQIGGHIESARLLTHQGTAHPSITASVPVDLTVTIFAQIIFTLLGVGVLMHTLSSNAVVTYALTGTVILVFLLLNFYAFQKNSPFSRLINLLERLVSNRDWSAFSKHAAALDAAVVTHYGHRLRLLHASCWRLLGWVAGTGETWLALYFLGTPVSLSEALMLESLSQALRAAAFMIPGALGVQEGGLLVLGALINLTPTSALALSLCKRVREILLGVPALLVWQVYTGNRFWKQRKLRLNEK